MKYAKVFGAGMLDTFHPWWKPCLALGTGFVTALILRLVGV